MCYRQLKHDNLVKLIGVSTQSNPVMMVAEYMAKGNLLDFLRSRGRSSVTPALQLGFTKDINAAMVYLEDKNFVHRDLAARNVLLDQDLRAKVADFGLAKDSRLGQIDLGKLPIKWTAPEALRQKVRLCVRVGCMGTGVSVCVCGGEVACCGVW